MPKIQKGVFIKCEKSIKIIIEKMDNEEKDIIAKDIDDTCCILNLKKYKKVLETIEKYQSKHLIEPTEL